MLRTRKWLIFGILVAVAGAAAALNRYLWGDSESYTKPHITKSRLEPNASMKSGGHSAKD